MDVLIFKYKILLFSYYLNIHQVLTFLHFKIIFIIYTTSLIHKFGEAP